MDRVQKKNTIGFDFGKSGIMPSLKEVISFIARDLKIKDTDVHSVYRDSAENTFFVKFNDETVMKETTQRLRTTETFTYGDGKKVQVHVAAADGFFRYVRMFNLPPEVTDADIAKVMAKFGTVRQLVREKLPSDLGFVAYNGTRGVHMEVKLEIPPALYVGHFKCRIFYEGLRNRCFICKEEGHVKAQCPTRPSVQSRIVNSASFNDENRQPASFAAVTKGLHQVTTSEPSEQQEEMLDQVQLEEPCSSFASVNVSGELMEISPPRTLQQQGGEWKTASRSSRSMEKRRSKRLNAEGEANLGSDNDVLQGIEDIANKRSKSSSAKRVSKSQS